MLEFIEELTEAKMFRGRETLSGKTADDIAEVVYAMFLIVEILRTEDSGWLKDYITNTMADEQFKSMRSSSSDLHNLIAVLSNQDKFDSKIKVNPKISPPLLQIKRYFRDILNDRKLASVDRAFFKSLEDFLKIKNSDLKHFRRTVTDWQYASTTEKRGIRLGIKNFLTPTNHQNDLLIKFFDKLRG